MSRPITARLKVPGEVLDFPNARASDFLIRPNLESEMVEYTFLPTGTTVELTLDESQALVAELTDIARRAI